MEVTKDEVPIPPEFLKEISPGIFRWDLEKVSQAIDAYYTVKGDKTMKTYYIPEEISIMNLKFKIEQTNAIYLSRSSTTNNTIKLREDLPEDRKLQVLIREILRICLELTGQPDAANSPMTQATAAALYSVLMENNLMQRPAE